MRATVLRIDPDPRCRGVNALVSHGGTVLWLICMTTESISVQINVQIKYDKFYDWPDNHTRRRVSDADAISQTSRSRVLATRQE